MSGKSLVWLITGCSSGFGEQFARQALARGDKVIATGRDAATKLKHLEGTSAKILDMDVSSDSKLIHAKINEAIKIYGRVDIVVNNAGYIESAAVEELGDERLRRSFDTNFFGPAGLKGDPSASGYCSTKHAIAGMVGCLSQEMAMFGLKCLLFEPGYFRTNALKQGNLKHEDGFIPAYDQFNLGVLQFETAIWGHEPGDPVKGVERMIEVITGTGDAAGRPMPMHVPVGADGIKALRERAQADLKICEDWESTMSTTDVSE